MNAAQTSFELGILYDKMNDTQSKKTHLNKSKEYFKNIGAMSKAESIEKMLEFNSVS